MKPKFDLVLNIGNTTLGGAFFLEDLIKETFHLSSRPLLEKSFLEILEDKSIRRALIGSDNDQAGKLAKDLLEKLEIPFSFIDHKKLSITLDVEEPKEVGDDRIANTYGALHLHPDTDLIVIDMGTAVSFDVITKDRSFIGGAIYPGVHISVKALAEYTDKLPLVDIAKPSSCVSRTTVGNIQSGIYYGLIGTIEKIIKEVKTTRLSKGKVKIVVTGGLASNVDAHPDSSVTASFRNNLEKDLKSIVNYFEPDLSFLGLYQILKEKGSKTKS